MMDDDIIPVKEKRLVELIKAEAFLNALFSAGVDNWNGYEDAQDIYEAWEDDNE